MDIIARLSDGREIHVQIENGGVSHVAERPGRGTVWGPPLRLRSDDEWPETNTYEVRA